MNGATDHGCVIQWRGVTKSFGWNEVLRGVSLEVRRGETLVIIGRSGCGKSVLLKTLVGLMKPDSGEVLIDGADIVRDREAMRRTLRLCGVVFQSAALFDSLTVAENLALPYWENTTLPSEEIVRKVGLLLDMVGMRSAQELLPSSLSGGMRKRVSLARAIADEPEIILYDEPTTGLDPITADSINDLILRMRDELGVTSIVVTHDLKSARKIADHVAMLHDGRIVFYGTVAALDASDDPVVRQFIEGRAEGDVRSPPRAFVEDDFDG